MTTLTLRYIKGDFVVTGSDIEPLRRRSSFGIGRSCITKQEAAIFERKRISVIEASTKSGKTDPACSMVGGVTSANCDLDRLGEIASRVIFRTDFCL